MRGFNFTRDFYVSKGSTKIADKQSDAVAYVKTIQVRGKAGLVDRYEAIIFFGKQNKPVSNFYYNTTEAREKAIKQAFDSRRSYAAYVQKNRDERKAYKNEYKVGEMLYTSWGYDQTNVEFFQVVDVKGKFVWLREIAGDYEQTGFLAGNTKPIKDKFLTRGCIDPENKPIRRLAQKHGIKICDVRTAWKCEGDKSYYTSSYA